MIMNYPLKIKLAEFYYRNLIFDKLNIYRVWSLWRISSKILIIVGGIGKLGFREINKIWLSKFRIQWKIEWKIWDWKLSYVNFIYKLKSFSLFRGKRIKWNEWMDLEEIRACHNSIIRWKYKWLDKSFFRLE